jgi:MFS family permease
MAPLTNCSPRRLVEVIFEVPATTSVSHNVLLNFYSICSVLEIGAFISSLLVGRVGDMIGRRRTILYGSIVFFIERGSQTEISDW